MTRKFLYNPHIYLVHIIIVCYSIHIIRRYHDDFFCGIDDMLIDNQSAESAAVKIKIFTVTSSVHSCLAALPDQLTTLNIKAFIRKIFDYGYKPVR